MSNVEVPSIPLASKAVLAELQVRKDLGSAQFYGRDIFDLDCIQLRRITAALGVSTNVTLAFWLLMPASGCPDLLERVQQLIEEGTYLCPHYSLSTGNAKLGASVLCRLCRSCP